MREYSGDVLDVFYLLGSTIQQDTNPPGDKTAAQRGYETETHSS